MVNNNQKRETQRDEIKEVIDVMVKDFDKKIKCLKEKKDNELNKITDEKVKEFMAYWMDEEMKELEDMKERITSIGKTSIKEFVEEETEDTKRKGRSNCGRPPQPKGWGMQGPPAVILELFSVL